MAIFQKDLENINLLNQFNSKTNIKSELLQFINLQNESSDYIDNDYPDLRFELDVSFRKHFEKNKNMFRILKRQSSESRQKLLDVFNEANVNNSNIFTSLERLIYAVKEEENLFANEMSVISENIKHSKKNRFDLLHSFTLNLINNENLLDQTMLNNNLSTTSLNLYYIRESLEDNDVTALSKLYNKLINKPLEFLKTYTGFNFLEISNNNKIKNNNKLLSLMSLMTAANNIINYSFNSITCNSIFKGIYTESELSNKINFTNFTNEPCVESDITKEILPLKYFDNTKLNNQYIQSMITEYNKILDNTSNIKKNANEKVKDDIFQFEQFLSSDTTDFDNLQATHKINSTIENNNISDNMLPHTTLLDSLLKVMPFGNFKNRLISIGDKTTNDYMQALVFISNHIKTNHVKPFYGLIKGDIPEYFIRYRQPHHTNSKGILSFHFEDLHNNLTSDIIKHRLLCNKIVKSYKKLAINNTKENLDSFLGLSDFIDSLGIINSSNTAQIDSNITFQSQSRRRNDIINNGITLLQNEQFPTVFPIQENSTSTSFLFLLLDNNNNISTIENNQNVKNNLIVINNSILGEMNADDFVSSRVDSKVTNLNRKINFNDFNLNDVNNQFNSNFNTIKKIANEYFDPNLKAFKNSSYFLKKIQEICAKSIQWHLAEKNDFFVPHSTSRADLLNNASILWLFNDSCKMMNENDKKQFQEQFISHLLCHIILLNTPSTRSTKKDFNISIDKLIMNYGPNADTITELAPFFAFFDNPIQNISTELPEYLSSNISDNNYETNGRSEHFLSIPCLLLDKEKNISYNVPHKLFLFKEGTTNNLNVDYPGNSHNPNKKRNTMLTGNNYWFSNYSSIFDKNYFKFVPQLIFKKINYRSELITTINTSINSNGSINDNSNRGVFSRNANVGTVNDILSDSVDGSSFKYFIYNHAHALSNDNREEFIKIKNLNYDLIQYYLNKATDVTSLKDIENFLDEQIAYVFTTKNDFLNVITFDNFYNNQLNQGALENNIFYLATNLISDIILKYISSRDVIGQFGNNALFFNNLYGYILNGNNTKVKEIKEILHDVLNMTSSIYCKMFNSFQSYSVVADRLFEGNAFFINKPDMQEKVVEISERTLRVNTPNTVTDNQKRYSYPLFTEYSNIFIESMLSSFFGFSNKELRTTSFATKKFMYFLKKIFGMNKNEILIACEHISTKKILSLQDEKLLLARYKDLDLDNSDLNLSNNEAVNDDLKWLWHTFLINERFEFMENPFEVFNLYNSKIFQLIPGLENKNYLANQGADELYKINLTNNLTCLNFFKSGSSVYLNTIGTEFTVDRTNTEYSSQNLTLKEVAQTQDNLIAIDIFDLNLKNNVEEGYLTNIDFMNTLNGGSRQVKSTITPTINNYDYISNMDRDAYRPGSTNYLPSLVSRDGMYFENNHWQYTDNIVDHNRYADTDSNYFALREEINFQNLNEIFIEITDYKSGGDVLKNKKNLLVNSILNSYNIFSDIVNYSFRTNLNYEISQTNDIRTSGLNDVDQYPSFLGISKLKSNLNIWNNNDYRIASNNNILNNFSDAIGALNSDNYELLNKKFVDVNLNWYNHIMQGLITNDLSLAMSYDFLLYYSKNFLSDINSNYQRIKNKRDENIIINYNSLNVDKAINNLKKVNNIDENIFEMSIENTKLQKNYLKSLIKTKSISNIVGVNALQNIDTRSDVFIEKIVSLNNLNENGDFLMNYFDDFYIKKLSDKLQMSGEMSQLNELIKNYNLQNNKNDNLIIKNQSQELIGSHILSVGINHERELDRDDIIIIKVEMTDHDFPEIVWESKIFEYYAGFEDIDDVFFQHSSVLENIDTQISIDNPPLVLSSFYSDYILNERNLEIINNESIKDSLIRKNQVTTSYGLDLSNNIGSVTYNNNSSYLNPFLFINDRQDILTVLNSINIDFISSKLPYEFREKLSNQQLNQIKDELILRCIHNQKVNLKLRKSSKLLNGFEPVTEFSLKNNKWMNDLIVLDRVYDLFITHFNSENINYVDQLYPFTYEDLSKFIIKDFYVFNLNNKNLKFHKMNLTSDVKINNFMYFLDKFTKSILPDIKNLTKSNFQKIYNLAINPKDFVACGLIGQTNQFSPYSSDLTFERIGFFLGNTSQTIVYDEIDSEPNVTTRLLSSLTPEQDNISYYRAFYNNEQYVPKNVSYKITTTILE